MKTAYSPSTWIRSSFQVPARMRSSASASRFSAGLGRAEAVAQLLAEIGQVIETAQPGEPAVELDLHARAGDVVAGQVGTPGELDRAVEERLFGLVGQAAHGRLQQRAIQLVADALDVAGLLGAQDVAGAADLQVAHGDLEPGPQRR